MSHHECVEVVQSASFWHRSSSSKMVKGKGYMIVNKSQLFRKQWLFFYWTWVTKSLHYDKWISTTSLCKMFVRIGWFNLSNNIKRGLFHDLRAESQSFGKWCVDKCIFFLKFDHFKACLKFCKVLLHNALWWKGEIRKKPFFQNFITKL